MRSLKNTIVLLCMIIFAMVAITVGTTFACVDLSSNDINSETEKTAPDNDSYWDEHVDELDTDWEGSGTESDPYLISSAEELAGLAYMVNSNNGPHSNYRYYIDSYFKQTVNIDISKYWWKTIGGGNESSSLNMPEFSGIYNGGNFKILGLFTKQENYFQGLFGYANGAVICNLGIENSIIKGYYAAGFIGNSWDCIIRNCYNTAEVVGAVYAGGFIAAEFGDSSSKIEDCYNAGNIKAVKLQVGDSSYAGGIIGRANKIEINRCFNIGDGIGIMGWTDKKVQISNSINCANGCFWGYIYGSGSLVFDHCYYSNGYIVSNDKYTGTISKISAENVKSQSWYTDTSNWETPWDFTNTWMFKEGENDGYPVLKAFYPSSWVEYAASSFAAGDGSEENPYQIATAEQLAKLAKDTITGTYYEDTYFKQTADIDLSLYCWRPISRFLGTYNGDGFTISGIFTKLENEEAADYQGLFGRAHQILNLKVIDSNIEGNDYVGGIAGKASLIKNCSFSGSVKGVNYVGGLVGSGITMGASKIGTGPVISSFNEGLVVGDSKVGGIAGEYTGTVANCYNTGTITANISEVGGICGSFYNRAYMYNCYNLGIISGAINGGLIGNAGFGRVFNCFNLGRQVFLVKPQYFGEIVGQNEFAAIFNNCYYGQALNSSSGSVKTTEGTLMSSLATAAKNINFYSNKAYWGTETDYIWDFDTVWEFVTGANYGFPVLRQDAVDRKAPTIHRATYVTRNNGYDVYAYVTDNVGVNRVLFPTWTEYNGQDDIQSTTWFQEGDESALGTFGTYKIGGISYNYKYVVNMSDHNNEIGLYNTHIYAYDDMGNEAGNSSANVGEWCTMEVYFARLWTDFAATSFAGGSGTEADPYQIANASQLAKLAKDSHSNNMLGVYFKQTANINLSGHIWDGIGGPSHELRFVGHYDGGYHSITNMKTSVGDYVPYHAGLFALTDLRSNDSIIKNVIIRDSQIEAENDAGAITGNGATYIQNCIVENTSVKARTRAAGGIIGCQYFNSYDCIVRNCTIESGNYAGGIVGIWGQASGECIDSAITGTTITASTVHAVAPNGTGTTTKGCYAQGTINGTATKLMYGDSSAWGKWTYANEINNGYPVQSGMFWIAGQSGSTNVYNYLKNTLGFSEA